MRSHEAATTNMPALIREARQMYETQPVAAALMLHGHIRRLKRPASAPLKDQGWHQPTPSHGENVLHAALWTIDIMGEDAEAGIAPTPDEWNLNTSVAESIVQMLEAANGPS